MDNEIIKTKKRGLIYYRVSTEDQATHGISLEQQKNACLEYAKRNDIEVVEIFHDDGVSAKTVKREDLQKMLKYCEKHYKEIGCVIIYRIDRLSRNVNDYTTILMLLSKLQIQLASTTEAVDESPTGQFVGTLMAANAQLDNQLRSGRTKDCMKTKFEKGYWQWMAPFGYKNMKTITDTKIIVLDPDRAPFVIWIFQEFSKGTLTLEEIRQQLNRKGVRTMKKKEISPQLMSKIIRNRFYTGMMTGGKGLGSDEDEQRGVHEAIVDDVTFFLCQDLLRGKPRADAISKSRRNELFPLRHQIRCIYCDRPITASLSTGKSGEKFPFYRCYYTGCPQGVRKSIPKAKLEKEFSDYLQTISPKNAFLKAFKAVILDVWDEQYEALNQERKRLTDELDRFNEEKRKLIDMKKKELLPDDDFRIEFAIVKEKIEKQFTILENTKLETFNIDEAVSFVFGIIERLPEVWEKANLPQKHQLLCLIFAEKPLYAYPKFETPVLSPILQTKTAHLVGESSLVTPRGIEPRLQG